MLILITPLFWFKAFKYFIIQIIEFSFSTTTSQTIFHSFDRYIKIPVQHYISRTIKWYHTLHTYQKVIIWIAFTLCGAILILFILRSPILLKLFWNKTFKFITAKSTGFVLSPYKNKLLILLSSIPIYRASKLYLLKNYIKPIRRHINQKYKT